MHIEGYYVHAILQTSSEHLSLGVLLRARETTPGPFLRRTTVIRSHPGEPSMGLPARAVEKAGHRWEKTCRKTLSGAT